LILEGTWYWNQVFGGIISDEGVVLLMVITSEEQGAGVVEEVAVEYPKQVEM
jgi:hypothetical protein